MKLKTSITIIAGCLIIFIFIMLPIILSIQDKKEDYVASFKGSEFSLKDMNNNLITEESFEENLTAIFFGFTHCPDVCPMTLNKMDLVLNKLKNKFKDSFSFLSLLIAMSILFNVIGQISGQFVKPKKIAVSGPLKESSVILLLFISVRENSEPLKDAT